MLEKISKELRNILKNQILSMCEKENEIGVFLSSGVGSNSILCSCLELDKKVTVYSFTLEDRKSTDFTIAENNAKALNLEFIPIYLPTSIDVIKKDVIDLIETYGARSKTQVEVSWPFLKSIPYIKHNVTLSGSCSDGWFLVTKSAKLNHSYSLEKADAYRKMYLEKDSSKAKFIFDLFVRHKLKHYSPYASAKFIKLFENIEWGILNKPKQKMPIRTAFEKEFKELDTKNRISLQLGDSGISELFSKLLNTDWNTRNLVDVRGVYNDIIKKVERNDTQLNLF